MKKSLVIILLLAITGCAYDPVIARKAGVRRIASQDLEQCLERRPGRPWTEKDCLDESSRYCQSQGLEAGCGIDGLWGQNWR